MPTSGTFYDLCLFPAPRIRVSRFRIAVICSLLLCGALNTTGCGQKTAQLKVYPSESLPFVQKFPRGFIGTNASGEDEIILISDGLQTPLHQGKILQPTSVASIRQIVEIRVLWKPLPGTRTDQPTATNASINWYVRSNMPGGDNDKIDYGGAGFVNVYPSKGGAHIRIRNAELAARQSSGDLENPFGKPAIVGTFDVVRNDGVVRDTIASLRTRVAAR